MLPNRSQLERAYRFMINQNVKSENILEPHFKNTVKRALQKKAIAIANDTTTFTYQEEHTPEAIGIVRGKIRGFFAPVSMAIDAQTSLPLGALDVQWNNRLQIKSEKNEGARSPKEEHSAK